MKRNRFTLKEKQTLGKKKRGSSNYHKKSQFLKSHGGFGFNYPEPKPWR